MKELIRNSTIYILLGFLPTAVNFVLVPLLSKAEYLPKAEYGLLSVSFIFQGIIAIFLNVGLDAAFARYYFNVYKKPKLTHAYYSTVLLTVLLLSVVVFGILYFTGDSLIDALFKNDRYHFSDFGIVTFGLALGTILHTVMLSYYRNEENIRMYALLSMAALVLTVVGMVMGVVWFRWGAYGSIWGRCLGYGIVVVLYLLFYYRNKLPIIHWKYLKMMLGYGIPFVPYLLILLMNSSLDQWMLERRFSLSELGEYNFGLQLASLVSVFIYAVFNAVSPRLYKLMAENKSEHDNEIRQLNRAFHAVVLLAIVGELAVIDPFVRLFIPNRDYHEVLDYMALLILAWLPHLYYMLYVVPIMFHNRTKFLPLITLVSLLFGIGANLLLIPIYGVIGVCLSTILIKVVSFVVTYLVSRQQKIFFPQHYRLVKNHMAAGLVAVLFAVTYMVNTYTDQAYRIWINLLPLLAFGVYSAFAFRRELQTLMALVRRRGQREKPSS